MPVCHFCTPEEDHIGRNVVYILKVLKVCPEISAACSDYNSLLCIIGVLGTLIKYAWHTQNYGVLLTPKQVCIWSKWGNTIFGVQLTPNILQCTECLSRTPGRGNRVLTAPGRGNRVLTAPGRANGVLTGLSEWLPGVWLRHSVPLVQYI